mgnify:CR=1 FL=1
MNQILCIALALFVGLLSSRLMGLLKLPHVTGYLISGIIFGPYVLGKYIGGWSADITSQTSINAIKWISEITLGFIAFTIGCSFKREALKSVGKKVVVITLCEALGGAVITIGALFIAHIFLKDALPISIILTLGAIACATAPAATLMVIRQYKARGPVVDTLIPVVAFDDAVALIAFAILFSVSKSLAGGTNISVMEFLIVPIIEILVSLGLGTLLGLLISVGCRFFKSRANRSIMIICSIFIVVGLSMLAVSKNWKIFGIDFTFSSLLSCMMIGAMFINIRSDAGRVIERIDNITPPLYMLFFVISGASLDITIFASKNALSIVIIALVYAIFRCVGKWTGSYISSKSTHAEPTVQKYLGFTLFPQAGVAIGLATTANQTFINLGYENLASMVLAVILSATIIYELVGPIITKIALKKAGEISEEKAA